MTTANEDHRSEQQKAIHDSAELFYRLRKKAVNGNLRSHSQIWDEVDHLTKRLDELKTIDTRVTISDGLIAEVSERLNSLPQETTSSGAADQFLGVLNEVLESRRSTTPPAQ